MAKNLKIHNLLTFASLKVYTMSFLLQSLPNKIVLWKERIELFKRWLKQCCMPKSFPFTFGLRLSMLPITYITGLLCVLVPPTQIMQYGGEETKCQIFSYIWQSMLHFG